jgi:two-component system response regulator AlgR
MQLAATLRGLAQPPAVVFVSAYAEHALKAFDVDAVDYLTKPVRPERLRAALERVLRVVQRQSAPMSAAPASAGAAAADTAEAAGGPGPALLISDRGRLLRLPLAELLYLKAEQKYVTLRSTTRELRVDESLSELEPRLGPGFVRVHRNAIVSRQAVRALELRAASVPDPEDSGGWAVCVAPIGEWLAVSRRQVAAVRAALAQPPPR